MYRSTEASVLPINFCEYAFGSSLPRFSLPCWSKIKSICPQYDSSLLTARSFVIFDHLNSNHQIRKRIYRLQVEQFPFGKKVIRFNRDLANRVKAKNSGASNIFTCHQFTHLWHFQCEETRDFDIFKTFTYKVERFLSTICTLPLENWYKQWIVRDHHKDRGDMSFHMWMLIHRKEKPLWGFSWAAWAACYPLSVTWLPPPLGYVNSILAFKNRLIWRIDSVNWFLQIVWVSSVYSPFPREWGLRGDGKHWNMCNCVCVCNGFQTIAIWM